MRCSMVERCYGEARRRHEPAPLAALLAAIRGGKWRKEVAHVRDAPDDDAADARKRKLPSFTTSALFTERGTTMTTGDPWTHTGLVALDYDGVDDPADRDSRRPPTSTGSNPSTR